MDVDQRERSVRSAASRELWDVVRERAGLSGAGSMSKSNEDRGEEGVSDPETCEYTLALMGVVGQSERERVGVVSSMGLSTSHEKSTSAGTGAKRGGGRALESEDAVGDTTIKWLLGVGGREIGD